jgi:hypothetical protein
MLFAKRPGRVADQDATKPDPQKRTVSPLVTHEVVPALSLSELGSEPLEAAEVVTKLDAPAEAPHRPCPTRHYEIP